ncbi:hypothetical protein EVAR_15817_1 [Eumeta japonica]|uniref:Uncharacterized protein n=1 Tax=Eumeta variegata TaxID=151549 RepID=A0A4C1TZN5_EUMVA|nr:hypothetical protein EVAR_15817_1 [Eumeta japonica]
MAIDGVTRPQQHLSVNDVIDTKRHRSNAKLNNLAKIRYADIISKHVVYTYIELISTKNFRLISKLEVDISFFPDLNHDLDCNVDGSADGDADYGAGVAFDDVTSAYSDVDAETVFDQPTFMQFAAVVTTVWERKLIGRGKIKTTLSLQNTEPARSCGTSRIGPAFSPTRQYAGRLRSSKLFEIFEPESKFELKCEHAARAGRAASAPPSGLSAHRRVLCEMGFLVVVCSCEPSPET